MLALIAAGSSILLFTRSEDQASPNNSIAGNPEIAFRQTEQDDDAGFEKGIYVTNSTNPIELVISAGMIESAFGLRVNVQDIKLDDENGQTTLRVTAIYHPVDVATERKRMNPRAVVTLDQQLTPGEYVVELNLIEIDNVIKPDFNKQGERFTTTLTVE